MLEHGLFVEKYRPSTVKDCILPVEIETTIRKMVEVKECHNLLFHGGAGCGKTSVARAICNDLDADYIIINCSEDGNIDTLRTKIRSFASTVSLNGNSKVVILDEFDYSNAQSIQPALRGAIEEFAKNCRFIITCNYKNRIISPIHSRFTNVDFTIPSEEKASIAMRILKRMEYILGEEGIEYDQEVIAKLVTKHFPDIRRMLNEIQRYSYNGKIDIGILSSLGDVQIKDLMKAMSQKNFADVRKWVVNNLDNSYSDIFRSIYDGLTGNLKPNSIPQAIVTLGEYQYKAAFVADQEINLTALMVELMMECDFK
jgi:DNA polymerase III delta prime subunit